jgi:methylated-DNA-[protein]-cysteine S-methyltransferase
MPRVLLKLAIFGHGNKFVVMSESGEHSVCFRLVFETKVNLKQAQAMRENIMNCYSILKSPINDLMLVTDGSALIGLYFIGCDHLPDASSGWKVEPKHPVLRQAARQLEEYFAGKRTEFTVPLRLAGTEFQTRVWRQIRRIPYGETISYSVLAKRAGAPQAIRAAGTTTGRNPLSIIIPCHRVMGKRGDLRGFAGGLDRKRHLLELEGSETLRPTIESA